MIRLVVDDNGDFLRLLSLEFTVATHWQVSTAQSVAEAEAICSSNPIDFALLDLLLPDGNGIDFLVTESQCRGTHDHRIAVSGTPGRIVVTLAIGAQLIGRRNGDRALLAAARWVYRALV